MTTDEQDWLEDEASFLPDLIPRDLRDGWEQASRAIDDDDTEKLRRLLAEFPDLARNLIVVDPLMTDAVEMGRVAAVSALLEAGVSPNLIDGSGGTPLMMAAWIGRLEIARVLLASGADPNILVEDHCHDGDPEVVGLCALYFALVKGHLALIDLLESVTQPEICTLAYAALERDHADDIRAEAEDGPKTSENTIRLFMAAQQGHLDRLREAISAGADPNAVLKPEASNRQLGSTPLSFAAARGRMEMVDALLRAGADPDLVDHLGRTAADFAASNGHDEVVARLRSPRAGG